MPAKDDTATCYYDFETKQARRQEPQQTNWQHVESRTSGSFRMAPRSGVRVSAAFRGVVSERLEVLQSTCQAKNDVMAKVSWRPCCAGRTETHVRTRAAGGACSFDWQSLS